MATFGEFFEKLRTRIEKSGRTNAACGDMDGYKHARCGKSTTHLEREEAWKVIADQELSQANLLDFSLEMTTEGVKRLAVEVSSENFNPEFFSWNLRSVYEFHYAILDEALKCGLKVEPLGGWPDVAHELASKSTRR